jgi:ubiquinone/menaquinone biosynthesis C-methylase UbiE
MQADYDAIAAAFSLSRKDMRWPEIDAMVSRVKPGSSVLDVGCGMGRLYGMLKDKSVDYLGVDVSEQQIIQAKKAHPDGAFAQGLLTALPCADSSQDVVFLIASLHHVLSDQDRVKAVDEIVRVLRPGGMAFVTVMNLWPRKYWSLFFQKEAGLRTLTEDEHNQIRFKDVFLPWTWKVAQPVYRYYHAFTKRELGRLFRRHNLSIESVSYIKDGRHSHMFAAKNLVLIARKIV